MYIHIFAPSIFKRMKKLFLSLAAILLFTASNAQPVRWNVDPSHTNVKFTVTHMMVSELDGSFRKFDGELVTEKPDFSDAQITFAVDVNSVFTDDEKRDNHLKSDDFFNAAKYPRMSFKSTSFRKVSEGKYVLEGDLTIRDVTKRVKFDVTGGKISKDPWGNTKTGFKAISTINRIQYGLKWNAAIEAGGWAVGEDVTIMLNVELNKAK